MCVVAEGISAVNSGEPNASWSFHAVWAISRHLPRPDFLLAYEPDLQRMSRIRYVAGFPSFSEMAKFC
jgi:hypothetical protein